MGGFRAEGITSGVPQPKASLTDHTLEPLRRTRGADSS